MKKLVIIAAMCVSFPTFGMRRLPLRLLFIRTLSSAKPQLVEESLEGLRKEVKKLQEDLKQKITLIHFIESQLKAEQARQQPQSDQATQKESKVKENNNQSCDMGYQESSKAKRRLSWDSPFAKFGDY